MPRFLIESSHTNEYEGCVRALDAITKHGSHLMTHIEWGCDDGVHIGWLVVDLDTREEALQLIPPQYRSSSRVVRLEKWSREDIEKMIDRLKT